MQPLAQPHPCTPWHLPPPSQVLCVFNNSTTSRAPLALALSVNDCKSWEPLAIIEEDPKGGWRGNGGASCEVRAKLQSSLVSAPTHWHAPLKPSRLPSPLCRQLLLPLHRGVDRRHRQDCVHGACSTSGLHVVGAGGSGPANILCWEME